LTVAIDFYFYQDNAYGYHLTNLLIHIFNVLLLFYILWILKYSESVRFITALIFAVHPVLAQNIAYVSARADMLSAFFLLLAFCAYLKKQDISFNQVLLFIFACLSKETAIVYPLFLLFFLYSNNKSIKKSLPFWIAAFFYFLLRQSIVGEFSQQSYRGGSLWITYATMVKAFSIYIMGFFWPLRTMITPNILIEHSWLNIRSLRASLLLIVFTGLFIKIYRKNKKVGYGMVWFVVFLLPVSNIVPIKAVMSWRFAYISMVGYHLFFAEFIESFKHKKYLILTIIPWLICLSFVSYRISSTFKDDVTLWRPVMKNYLNLYKPYRVFANHYLRQDQYDSAIKYCELGLEKFPGNSYLLWDLGVIYNIKGDYQDALHVFRQVSLDVQKEIGIDFLYSQTFALYNLQKFAEISRLVELHKLKELPIKLLNLQAHALVLTKNEQKAKQVYLELLSRNVTDNAHEDYMNILDLMNSG